VTNCKRFIADALELPNLMERAYRFRPLRERAGGEKTGLFRRGSADAGRAQVTVVTCCTFCANKSIKANPIKDGQRRRTATMTGD
jgi:hypothetical protein